MTGTRGGTSTIYQKGLVTGEAVIKWVVEVSFIAKHKQLQAPLSRHIEFRRRVPAQYSLLFVSRRMQNSEYIAGFKPKWENVLRFHVRPWPLFTLHPLTYPSYALYDALYYARLGMLCRYLSLVSKVDLP